MNTSRTGGSASIGAANTSGAVRAWRRERTGTRLRVEGSIDHIPPVDGDCLGVEHGYIMVMRGPLNGSKRLEAQRGAWPNEEMRCGAERNGSAGHTFWRNCSISPIRRLLHTYIDAHCWHAAPGALIHSCILFYDDRNTCQWRINDQRLEKKMHTLIRILS